MIVSNFLLELLFSSANLFVLPFWTLMILVPNAKLTRQVMSSYIPYAVLAGLYIFLFVTSFTNVDGVEALSNPDLKLADLATLFASPHVTAIGWVHFLVFDLFVGRWIYWQGQQSGVITRHSLALCLFAGPIGLVSHLITETLWKLFTKESSEEAPVEAG